jgi:Homeodomain-like domain-containing protein
MLKGEEEREETQAESALERYLRGQRPAAIAEELSVSASTVRRWIRVALAAQAAEVDHAGRAALLARAIESQRAIASAAWESYERERKLDDALLRGELDHVRRRALRTRRRGVVSYPPTALETGDFALPASGADDDCPPVAEEVYERPKRSIQGVNYLKLALAAQREVARLQGLYERLEASAGEARITVTRRPAGNENQPPAESAPDEAPSS